MLVLGGFSVIALTGLAFWTYFYFRELTVEQVTRRQQNVIGDIVAEFDTKIAMSHRVAIHLATALRHRGDELGDADRARRLLHQYGSFSEFFTKGLVLLSPGGEVLAEIPDASASVKPDFPASEYFRRTLAENRPIISAPYLSPQSKKFALALTAPVQAPDGRIVAVVCGSIDLSAADFFTKARRHGYAAAGRCFYILDANRQVIYSSAPCWDLPASVDGWLMEAGARLANDDETLSRSGAEIVTAGRMETTGWLVAVIDSGESVFAPMRHFRNLYIVLVAGILLTGTLLAHLLARGLTGNLERFTAHLQRLPHLPAEQRPFVSTAKDETQLVSAAFNLLLRELEEERRELLLAKNRAEVANETKSRFMSNVSHELRTPLHGIIGLTQLCLETELTAEQREQLAGILVAGKSLLRLINDLLVVQKIEGGQVQLETNGFSLRHLLERTARMFRAPAQEKGLELHLDVPTSLPDLFIGDSLCLQKILGNLLDNACKFSDRGTVTLGVAPLAEANDTVELRFFVRDEGRGIAADRLDKIFHRFERGDETHTRSFGGVGLGLAISRQTLALLGSSLEVASTPGSGSTFSFVLTFTRQRAPETPDPLPAAVPPGCMALVVAYSPAGGKELANSLRRLQIQPVIADPDRPQEHLAGGKVDLILLDCSAGAREPWEVVHQLRQHPGGDGLLVLIPRFGLVGDAERCAANGVDGYLNRPFSEEEFADFISYLLVRRNPRADFLGRRPVTLYEVEESLYRLTVLVAEDIEINRKIVSSILLRHGHRVLPAVNGREAVDIWRQKSIDLIFMDVQMPEMDGLEATRLIRAEERSAGKRRTPIVAVTAGVLPEEKGACFAAGMDGYLLKPFDLAELRSLLVRAVAAKLEGKELFEGKETA